MSTYWTVRTRYGAFFITPSGGGFEVRFEDEPLGSYHSLASALDNLLSGQVDWPSTGLDPSKADVAFIERLTCHRQALIEAAQLLHQFLTRSPVLHSAASR